MKDAPTPTPALSFFSLLRYAGRVQCLLMTVGLLAALLNGVSIPLLAYITGVSTDAFNQPDPLKAIKPSILTFVGVGFLTLFLSFVQMACWTISGQRQAMRMRTQFVKSLFSQEPKWFDKPDIRQHSSLLSTQITTVQKAISEAIPGFVMMVSTVFASFILAFVSGWQLALLGCLAIPIISVAGHMFGKVIRTTQSDNRAIFAECASKTQQIFSSILAVKTNVAQSYQQYKFIQKAKVFMENSVKAGWKAAFSVALFISTIPMTSSLIFWYGARLISEGAFNSSTGKMYEAGNVFSVFFTIFVSGMNLGQTFPALRIFSMGTQSGASIFSVIDLKREGQNQGQYQLIPEGNIRFKDVSFSYNQTPILKNLDLQILPFKRNVIVGETGSGKSTIAQLILKLYSICSGQITVDARLIDSIDSSLLRQSIGYVSQDPSIFSGTLRDNLLFANPQATDRKIFEALEKAQALQFVDSLPNKLQTYLGPSGCQLSGGQRQRLALARIFLKRPRILILDQATSALDNINQQLVQQSLEKQFGSITTIVIAHRFKTIVKADRINILSNGICSAFGTYAELYQTNAWFRNSADHQQTFLQSQDSPIRRTITKAQEDDQQQDTISVANLGESLLSKPQQPGKIQLLKRLFTLNKEDRLATVASFLIAVLNGTLLPLFSLFLAHIIANLLYQNGTNSSKQIYGFITVGVLMFVCNYFQYGTFMGISERLGLTLRHSILKVLLAKPYPYFTKEQHSVGKLSKLMYEDVNHINKLTSTFIGLNLQNVSSLTIGLIISLANCWQLTLVCFALLPLLAGSALVQLKGMNKINQSLERHYLKSAGWLSETITLSKLIKASNREKFVQEKYEECLIQPRKASLKKGLLYGVFFGISQFVFFIIFALVFLMGAVFLSTGVVPQDEEGVKRMFTSLLALLFSSTPIGYYAQFMPDISAGQRSTKKVFKLLDSDVESSAGQSPPENINSLEVKRLQFTYQSRRRVVLNNLNLSLRAKEKHALVGVSGCGKSTLMLILMKLFQPQDGQVLLNGRSLKQISSKKLRQITALVPQESYLFDASLKENICYAKDVSSDFYQLVKAKLGIDFCSDSQRLGVKGSLLSGGQRQRVALARALVRKPKILLLDQSTSALDSGTEERILQAVKELAEESIVISIVHRLSTVRQADLISVMQGGQVVQQGVYESLMEQQQGEFRRLWQGKS